MRSDKTAIERAFDLAKSGKFETVLAIKRELSHEGYSTIQIAGPVSMMAPPVFTAGSCSG
jgi:hypothetical protein